MSVMITEVYQALRSIDVPEELATRAAEAVGQHHDRLGKIEARLVALERMVGAAIALLVGLLVSQWAIYSKIADFAQQVGMLAGRLH